MRNMFYLYKPRPHPHLSRDSREIRACSLNHPEYNTKDAKNPIWHWEFRLWDWYIFLVLILSCWHHLVSVVQKTSEVRINIIDDNRQGERDECLSNIIYFFFPRLSWCTFSLRHWLCQSIRGRTYLIHGSKCRRWVDCWTGLCYVIYSNFEVL